MTGDNSESGSPKSETGKRSKRLYVYWGAALALLIAAGLVSWLVVVPVWRVQRTMEWLTSQCDSHETMPVWPRALGQQAIGRLGGAKSASEHLALYLRLPGLGSFDDDAVVLQLLGECGPPAEPVFQELLDHKDEYVRQEAASALTKIRAAQRARE